MSLSARIIPLTLLLAGMAWGACDVRACGPRAGWRDRAERTVDQAVFFKPDPKAGSPDDVSLMPLVVIAQKDASGGPHPVDTSSEDQARIATVRERGGRLAVIDESSTVYAVSGEADIHGITVRQWTFVWWVSSSGNDAPAMAAIRMTLNAGGQPMVWEALNPSEKKVGVFVAESLEAAVRREFEDEQDGSVPAMITASARGRVTVARVLNDGPAPMGPMVYCDRRGAIVTVACRCMPSQVREVARNEYYRVVRLDDLAEIDDLLSLSGDASFQRLMADWRRPTWLSEALRWPKEF